MADIDPRLKGTLPDAARARMHHHRAYNAGRGDNPHPERSARTYEKDSQGLNKMPSIDSLGAPRGGSVYHSTAQGSTSPLRHEVLSYGDMHTVNTYGVTAKGEQKLSAFMTDRAPRFENDTLSFGGGNTFDMATGKQAPSGASWKNAKNTNNWTQSQDSDDLDIPSGLTKSADFSSAPIFKKR